MSGASFLFPALIAHWTDAAGKVDYRSLFLVPTGMALVAVLMLAAFFRPPQRGPVARGARPPGAATLTGAIRRRSRSRGRAAAWRLRRSSRRGR